MGSGGPGNITHIDNLYVKTVKVKSNTKVTLGSFLIFDTDGYRDLATTDFSANDTFLDLDVDNVVQAGEDADNLTSTPVNDRKPEVAVITKGADWVTKMAAGVEPGRRVGISRLDARVPIIAVADVEDTLVTPSTPLINQHLGNYKHKEFARLAEDSLLNDDGIISTGVV